MRAYGLLLALPALISAQAFGADKVAECEQMDSMAESVMKARQNGIPMSKLYKIAVKGDDYTSAIYKMLIDGAYKETRFGSPEYQEKAVVDFRDLIFQACINQPDKTNPSLTP